jgi:hypothetical protein
MKRVRTLEAKSITPVHQEILRAMKSSVTEQPSRLTAAGPTVLLRQIMTIEEGDSKEAYSRAMCELTSARWIISISQNPGAGLARYRLSDDADLYVRKLDSKKVSKEMARSHA